ncbi:hypothetical protein BgiBS90_031778 [Biomphalaria glabrata]|nr:hypothetical protein BgiBS90_031778 [Biomphalaria glabrata]
MERKTHSSGIRMNSLRTISLGSNLNHDKIKKRHVESSVRTTASSLWLIDVAVHQPRLGIAPSFIDNSYKSSKQICSNESYELSLMKVMTSVK